MVTGLSMDRIDALGPEDFNEDGKGLPPSSRSKNLPPFKLTEKACLRSHVKAWKKMLREGWNSMLVLEDDAAWDVNISDITHRLAGAFYEFRLGSSNLESTIKPSFHDPYSTEDWDILSFGTCSNHPLNSNESLIFHDPHVPSGFEYFGTELDHQRVIRKAGDLLCTTGYAITRSGAKKLLLRVSIDSDESVDIVMCQMAENEELRAYTVFPRPIGQWAYFEGIGGESLGSLIQDSGKDAKEVSENAQKDIWEKVRKERNVWRLKGEPAIKNLALAGVNEYVYSDS